MVWAIILVAVVLLFLGLLGYVWHEIFKEFEDGDLIDGMEEEETEAELESTDD